MLAWTLYSAFLGVLVLMFVPVPGARWARGVALASSLTGLGIALLEAVKFKPAGELITIQKWAWIPSLGIDFHLAYDGISLTLVLLTGIASVAGILFSWNVEKRPREFFAFYLALIGGVHGVFLSFDLFQLFVFYEIAIIPKYFLIAIWGSTNREFGAMKLALYSFVGSALVLAVMVAAYVLSGSQTFSLPELAKVGFSADFQRWAFPVSFVGFAILAGLWPFHTWAPTGHVAAPTAASMLLAGVVMKLGAYGALRVSMALFPQGLKIWHESIGWLAVAGIVLGALVALAQSDFKFVIGYSSVSHMGFVLLGLASMNIAGLVGAVLQMFSHGILAGLLFGVVGRMVYDRAHTRNLDELKQLNLGRELPFAAATFVLAGCASMGLPGFSGFVAELQVLMGAWKRFPWMAIAAGLGIVVGAAYTLRAMQRAFFAADAGVLAPGTTESAAPHDPWEPISCAEKLGAVSLLAISIAIGLYPAWMMIWIQSAFDGAFFAGLRKVVGW
ncbi:MAG: NADH-quinone oxidoreductase subunit M [Verrucomicrobia bacterium]|nr:NADH-quinone oxidoreductase subunit M [Verrucomicrobiota bacterium]